MKLFQLSNIEFILVLFLYTKFSQISTYHLKNKNEIQLNKFLSSLKDETLTENYTDIVNTFLKSISVQNYEDGYLCKGSECAYPSSRCVPKGYDYFCECLPGYILKEGNFKETNRDECEPTYQCMTEDCVGANTQCVAKADSYYCECLAGYEPEDEIKKYTKEVTCKSTYQCKTDDCKGANAKCVPKANHYYCECLTGYEPEDKSRENTKDAKCNYRCKSSDCVGVNAKCVPKDDSYICECLEGYELEDKIEENTKEAKCKSTYQCKTDDCKGANAKCVPKADSYICECLAGFEPEDESEKNTKDAKCKYQCKSSDCVGVNAKCVPKDDSYICECLEGYELEDKSKEYTKKAKCKSKYQCKTDDCKGTNAMCVAEADSYYCECLTGYEPEDKSKENTKEAKCKSKLGCEELGGEKECGDQHKVCKNKADIEKKFECGDCIVGYKLEGTVCTEVCDCGAYSHDCNRDEKGYHICDCFDGYAQYKNVCADCYCGQRSLSCTFDEIGHKTCKCLTGYAQRNVTCAAMCKSNSDCLNGGICRYEGNGYFCKCREHFKGDRCEINDVCDSMMETCDAFGAVCSYNELLGKGFCECPPNRAFNRKLKICEDICKPGSCLHGKCEVVDYHKECRCYKGYEGVDCDQKIFKITDKLEWDVVFAMLLVSVTCFTIVSLCILIARQFKTKEKHGHCKNTCMMESSG